MAYFGRMHANPAGRRTPQHFGGCLLGGAVGDALGAAVEFLPIEIIRQKYGAIGITDFDVTYGRRGAITDDTQMTLFTAEGALRAETRWNLKGICHPASVIYHAYIRWLHTQGASSQSSFSMNTMDGWLIGLQPLHHTRAPGRTCLTALSGAHMGTMQQPFNTSKGCGGVMRMAPIGLIANSGGTAFSLGCEAAAITHGHPSGYYSAGCFAAIIWFLIEGHSLPDAIDEALQLLVTPAHTGHEECATAMKNAVAAWRDPLVTPSPETIADLGGGWVGEEALAIGLYCALHAGDDFARAVRLAVNHSGDSDSTGAITGNLVGLMLGAEAIPANWLRDLELRNEIEAMARDLHTRFEESEAWLARYPGW